MNNTPSNTICIENNITHKDVFFLGEINIKEEYGNAEPKIPSEAFVENVDSKPEFLKIEECKITYNSDTQNFHDCKSFIYQEIKSENGQMDINLAGTELCDKDTLKKENMYYSNSVFKFNCNDIPSKTICIKSNTAQKDGFPLAEIDSKAEGLKIEDSKVSYNLDSQNVDDDCQSLIHDRFKSEDSEMDPIPLETEVYDKESLSNDKIYNCSKCTLQFDSKLGCILHLKAKHIVSIDAKSFKCNLCECESKYKSNIERHMKNKHAIDNEYKSKPVEGYTRSGDVFRCNLCEYESKRRWDMCRHVQNKHKENERPKCKYKSGCKSELKERLITQIVSKDTDRKKFVFTAQNLYKCKSCDYECRHRSGIYRHILIKHNRTSVKVHKCSRCEYQTHDTTVMKRHLLIHDDVRPYECEICNKHFRRSHHLKGHSAMHSGEKRFQCPYCDYRNNYKSSVKMHMKNKHAKSENKDYRCSQCPYETNFKPHLSRHVKRHLLGGEKEFKCPQCSYSTNFKSDLRMHVQNKHKEVKEYKCKRCKYKTNYKVNMKQHILNHDDVKLYECKVCKKLFKWKVSLDKHIRCIHLDEKNFHCAHCNYKTNYKSHLVVHINSQHTATYDRKYKCTKCNYETHDRQVYRRHVKNHVSSKRGKEKKYICKECNYKTNFKRLFTGHILTNHAN